MELFSGVLAIIPAWLWFLVIAGIALYWYYSEKFDYWERAGIPYMKPVPFLGSMWKLVVSDIREMELERYKTKGRVYGVYEGSRPTLTIADPDILRDIFVKDFQFFTNRRAFLSNNRLVDNMVSNLSDEDWKRVRTLITPTFTTGKIRKMTNIFIDSAQTVVENFKKAASEGKPVDVKWLFGAFTMDVIASSAFATKIDSHNNPENPFVSNARSFFSRHISWRLLLLIFYPSLTKLLRISPFPPRPLKFFQEVTLKLIEERKRSGKKRNDFLQMLMDAESNLKDLPEEKDEASDIGHEEANSHVFRSILGSKSLSNDEMVAQCVVFFLAGYDTTATTMAITAYELARNPDIQEKLIAEVDETIRNKGDLRYETIYDMKYLDCVISETLRKYPPAVRTERVADDEYHIKRYDITLPKGMIVGIPIYAIHQDPEHYPDPERYDPERFSPEIKATRHPYTYLPFGAGPRNCIAMRFALMEVKVCMAYLMSRVRFHVCPETEKEDMFDLSRGMVSSSIRHKAPLQFYFGQGALSPKEITLKVEIRNDSVQL